MSLRETHEHTEETDTDTPTHISYDAYLWQWREGMREGGREKGGDTE